MKTNPTVADYTTLAILQVERNGSVWKWNL